MTYKLTVTEVETFGAKVYSWLRQPTTVAGIAVIAGSVEAALTKTTTWAAVAPVIIGGVVGLAMPDNTGAKTSASKLVTDIVPVVQGKAALDVTTVANLLADANAVADAVDPKTVTTTTTVVSPAATVAVTKE